jgi:REP element-mobilizing transposase RayT
LIGISNNEHNLLDIIKYLKSKTFFQLKSKYNTPQLWQDRFYDYIPRKDEDVYKHARYILENPVRKKMVTNFADYPYSGGIYFDDLINA